MRFAPADPRPVRRFPVQRLLPAALCALALGLTACPGGPRPNPTPEPAGSDEASFDPAAVPEAERLDALERVTTLVNDLNDIIRAKDYEAWRDKLLPEYVEHFSTPAVLAELSRSTMLKRQGIVLLDLRDYFIHVVYPARQFDRVDDVEFVAEDRVRAITITPKGERLVLYDLAKSEDTWKISIGRQP